MALNVGPQFRQRWLNAPEAVRQVYIDELQMICKLLAHDTDLTQWQQQHTILQQRNDTLIAQAYAVRKQQLLAEQAHRAELRRQARQAELEQRLAHQRAEARAVEQALLQDEEAQFAHQNRYLQQYAEQLLSQPVPHAVRFDTAVGQPISLHADLRTRLELEADYYIEQTLQQLRNQLKAAAREEIEIILAQQEET